MKQFSLEGYLKNPDRKLITRDGRNVRIICTDRRNDDRDDTRIILALVMENGREFVYSYYPNGKHCASKEAQVDLFFEPTKKTGWINLYDLRGKIVCGVVYASEKAARGQIDPNKSYITTIPIEWEE